MSFEVCRVSDGVSFSDLGVTLRGRLVGSKVGSTSDALKRHFNIFLTDAQKFVSLKFVVNEQLGPPNRQYCKYVKQNFNLTFSLFYSLL